MNILDDHYHIFHIVDLQVMKVMTSMVKYWQLGIYRVMGVIFMHFGCAEFDFLLRLFILSTLASWRSWRS